MAKRSSAVSRVCLGRLAAFAVLISLGVSSAEAQQAPVSAQQGAQTPTTQTSAPATPAPSTPPPAQTAEEPETLHLLVGHSLVITSPTRIKRVSLADPEIAEAIVVSPYQVVLSGKAPGGVSFLVWDEADQTETFEVSVDLDILSLRQKIQEEFPSEPVKIEASGDVVMISGKISSAEIAAKILEFVKAATPKVTSLMEVPLPPTGDILLQVVFAEVDKTKLTELGINVLSIPGAKNVGTIGTEQFAPPSLQSSTTTTSSSLTSTFALSDLLNIFLYRPDINLAATIKALQEKDVLQILAEPNLLTASGKDASFLAGGEFPYPILQGVTAGGTGAITIQFKEFGVRLTFTPTLQADGYIHLKVAPEVSALDFANALTIQGFVIPALSTRRVEGEMDLKDGQSFAIAGLLDNRVTDELEKIPWIGDIPVLGKLFQSRSLTKSRDELLIIVTPHIVQPLNPGQLPAGPTFPQPFLGPTAPEQPKAPS